MGERCSFAARPVSTRLNRIRPRTCRCFPALSLRISPRWTMPGPFQNPPRRSAVGSSKMRHQAPADGALHNPQQGSATASAARVVRPVDKAFFDRRLLATSVGAYGRFVMAGNGRGRPPIFQPDDRQYLADLIRRYGASGARERSAIPISKNTLLKIAQEFEIPLRVGRRPVRRHEDCGSTTDHVLGPTRR